MMNRGAGAHEAPRWWSRVCAATGVLALGAGLGIASAASASATERPVDDATFVWGLNGYAQKGIFGPWTYKDIGGDASVLVGSVSGGSQTEYVVAPVPVTSMPANTGEQKTPNAIKFVNGTGTVDEATGARELSWSGTYTVNAYPAGFGAPDEIYADPVLTVAADGSGTLTFDVTIGAGVDMEGNPMEEQELGRLTLATFDAADQSNVSDTGLRITPDYQGVAAPGSETQTTTCTADGGATGWWGSWPAEFVGAIPAAIRPHFYSTGCGGMQDLKPALPFDVSYSAAEGETPDGEGVDLEVTLPEKPSEPGVFAWTIDGAGSVSLGTAVVTAAGFTASGDLPTITVKDTREGAPAWSLSGQSGAFSGAAGSFGGQSLGWTPAVSENTVGAVKGADVAPGLTAGDGLSVARTLASSAAGHDLGDVKVDAGLSLLAPSDAPAGDYTATLTLTALS